MNLKGNKVNKHSHYVRRCGVSRRLETYPRCHNMKNKTYHIVRTVPKSKRIIVESDTKSIPLACIFNSLLTNVI